MKKLLFLFALCFISTTVFASDIYKTQIESLNRVGRSVTWEIELTIDKKGKEEISGLLKIWGAGPCNGSQPIKGVLVNDNLTFKVIEHEVKGCGNNTFNGKLEPSAIIGKLFFNGKFHDVVFAKQ
jgi:hypothetical protein